MQKNIYILQENSIYHHYHVISKCQIRDTRLVSNFFWSNACESLRLRSDACHKYLLNQDICVTLDYSSEGKRFLLADDMVCTLTYAVTRNYVNFKDGHTVAQATFRLAVQHKLWKER